MHADVAQLARASPCQGEGRGFEPRHPLQDAHAHLGAGSLRSRDIVLNERETCGFSSQTLPSLTL